MNKLQPLASAVLINAGRILAIGNEESVTYGGDARCEVINLAGKTILPGLVDGHLHLEHFALALQRIDCEVNTLEECLNRVAEKARTTPRGAWILGHGWNQNLWSGGFGNAPGLDQVSGDHPVYLTAKSLHAAWANTAALQQASITSDLADPQGGQIQRDPSGNPTGILLESAMNLIEKIIPQPSDDERKRAIHETQAALWQMGLTGVHDFDRKTCFRALQQIDQAGELKLRVIKSIPYELLDEAVDLGIQSGFGGNHLKIGSVKLFADGALGPRTAWMLVPYENEQEYTGFPFLDCDQIFSIGKKAAQSSISLAVHAIGDRANRECLQALNKLRRYESQNHLPPLRHRIEHVQVLSPIDLGLFSENEIIASMQPIHATSDMDMADIHWGARSEYAYAWNSLIERRTRLVFGSDAPVESPNPFWGLHAAVTRCRRDGTPGPQGWYPQQRITLQQALEGFTIGPAYAAGLEMQQGQLRPGFFADLIVLNEDPFTTPPLNLHRIRPAATMVDGEWVWLDPSMGDIQ